MLKSRLKNSGLALLGRITNRHVVMLPLEARSEGEIFDLRSPYRSEDPLRIELREGSPGSLKATLLGYKGHFPTQELWQSPQSHYAGPCDFVFSLSDGTVHLDGKPWGKAPVPLPSRRFCWSFSLSSGKIVSRKRTTSHYVPLSSRTSDAGYFQGDNYVDHELQSAGEQARVIELMRRHTAAGPTLEIGCATGGLLKRLDQEAMSAFGIDISEWAVEKSKERLGCGRVWHCDAETGQYPDALLQHAPFGTLVLWAVFEHFRDPFRVLEKLTRYTRSGTTLIMNTTNADSLSHKLFGSDWEGFFDWTHQGVDQVSVATIRREFVRLGWEIRHLSTHLTWDGNVDPTRATFREWWAADGRFRRMLFERDLGDLITCVAVRE
jgi:2-polyprenyl-3-methyl-5-hydroxy-6-metoxy-1,4-benzoquinol methylase